jgi:hypothetical protein
MLSRAGVGFLITLLSAVPAAQARDAAGGNWTTFRNERFGFSLDYPADVFQLERASDAGDGQIFVSREGDARLLVGALSNNDGLSPAAYQNYVARQSYADFAISYRRLSASWFVLSGQGKGKTFYEKVIFSCNGRLINSFAMIYPSDRGHVFDRIVEGIEKSFRPGTIGCERDVGTARPPDRSRSRSADLPVRRARSDPHAALADRIARSRGKDVLVVLRRTGPPYDYKVVRGYARP